MIGDLAGFVAATFYPRNRDCAGADDVLAMVDAADRREDGRRSSAGERTRSGAFHQPKAVLIDPLTLKDAAERE